MKQRHQLHYRFSSFGICWFELSQQYGFVGTGSYVVSWLFLGMRSWLAYIDNKMMGPELLFLLVKL